MRALLDTLNTKWHERALLLFLAIVVAHWAEHLVQAFQIYVLDWSRPESRGVFGQFIPWLVTSEALHYGYAIVMLAFFAVLLKGFQGRAALFWGIALGIQFWHHIEHFLLLYQRVSGDFFFGAAVPTSIMQHFVMRVELHLFYNTIVFIPMVIAMLLHMFPPESERGQGDGPRCSCDKSHWFQSDPTPTTA